MIVGVLMFIHWLCIGMANGVHARPPDRRAKIVENLILFFFLPLLVASKDTIAINQTLKDGEVLISKENNFVLGFFSPGHSRYRYLGVWFHKVSELTAVWVANRDSPINGSSGALKLDHHGELVLYADSDEKVVVWSSNVLLDVTVQRVAQLLDSGNLVLVQDGSSSKRIVWQSFDYPTNTVMNGMTLGLNRKTGRELYLTSWRSTDDPGTGDYSFKFNTDGPPQFFLHKGTNNYWRSCPWPWRNFATAYNHTCVDNEDGVYLLDHQDNSAGIRRLVMDESGLIRNLLWDESDSLWKENWGAPRYWCDSFGNCGSFRKCNAENVKSLECACLPGYEAESLGDWNLRNGRGRCIKKRQDSSLVCGQKVGFLKVANAKVPDASQAVRVNMNASRMDCEQECMGNMFCLAYAIVNFTGVGNACLAWYGQLMETIDFADEGYDLYICVDALGLAEDTRKSIGSLDMKEILAVLMPSVALGWIIIIIVIACFWIKTRKKRGTAKNQAKKVVSKFTNLDFYKDSFAAKNHGERSHPELEFFDLGTVYAATENFSPANKLGQGGFGSVYKGQLSDGQEVAVKRLSKSSGQGMEEFANEVMLIVKLQHRNLVKLLGCCIQGEEPMLIYEYLPNKSLDLFLFDQTRRKFLDWRKRFDIIVGIARGIMYLHQDSRLRIIHRDLKSSNVLLDAEMKPKISDFGMARIFNDDQNQNKTKRVVGTYGYMSPEYAVFGKFSVKSDVFSFGVILLEIISGKKNTDFYQDDVAPSLIGYVWEFWRGSRALEVVDSSLKQSYLPREALRCIHIGLLCVQEYASDRPTMLDVVFMLNSDMPLPHPNRPAFVFQKSKNDVDLSVGEEPYSVNLVTISDVLSR